MKKFIGYEKGVDFGGWLSQCSEYTDQHYKTFIVKEDFSAAASWGIDHIRLPELCMKTLMKAMFFSLTKSTDFQEALKKFFTPQWRTML